MERKIKSLLLKLHLLKYYAKGRSFYKNPEFLKIKHLNLKEISKKPSRKEIINFLLSLKNHKSYYLEIGVRNPNHNFHHIKATHKYSVDPGLEYRLNPVDFKMTSDVFFEKLSRSEVLSNNIKFDVIFIDGLHLAEQVDRDISNALKYIKDDGFIVLHDCNPPSEWHAREHQKNWHTPAEKYWNGTTWKAFIKWRCSPLVNSCCINTDWGVGILSRQHQQIGKYSKLKNEFFEFSEFKENRVESLNLIDFETFKGYFN